MPQRISDEEIKVEIERLSPICTDRSTSCIHCDALEIILDLRDAREHLKIAVAALEYVETALFTSEGGIGELLAVIKAVEIHAHTALDRIKGIS